MRLFLALLLFLISSDVLSQSAVDESIFKPYKNNYLLRSNNQGSKGGCDAKVQISFVQNWYEDSPTWAESFTHKIAFNFSYTQTFFDDLCEDSKPVTAINYKPGLILALGEDKNKEGVVYRPFKIGWEHQSNGEFQGVENRGWDRFFLEVKLGYNPKERKKYLGIPFENSNQEARKPSVRFQKSDALNARFRLWSEPFSGIANENVDIDEFYGRAEVELSFTTKSTQFSIFRDAGWNNKFQRGRYIIEFSTKYIPILGNFKFTKKFFDRRGENGSWMVQHYEGFGEDIRDYNQEVSGTRIGFRFY